MNTEPYTVIAPGMIKVCANCFPGESIFDLFPDLRGAKISHGACAGHRQKWIEEAERLKAAKAASKLTFGDLRPGDCFRLIGCDGEDLELRKAGEWRAFNVQDGVWRDVPKSWPVVRTDNIMDNPTGQKSRNETAEALVKLAGDIGDALKRAKNSSCRLARDMQ